MADFYGNFNLSQHDHVYLGTGGSKLQEDDHVLLGTGGRKRQALSCARARAAGGEGVSTRALLQSDTQKRKSRGRARTTGGVDGSTSRLELGRKPLEPGNYLLLSGRVRTDGLHLNEVLTPQHLKWNNNAWAWKRVMRTKRTKLQAIEAEIASLTITNKKHDQSKQSWAKAKSTNTANQIAIEKLRLHISLNKLDVDVACDFKSISHLNPNEIHQRLVSKYRKQGYTRNQIALAISRGRPKEKPGMKEGIEENPGPPKKVSMGVVQTAIYDPMQASNVMHVRGGSVPVAREQSQEADQSRNLGGDGAGTSTSASSRETESRPQQRPVQPNELAAIKAEARKRANIPDGYRNWTNNQHRNYHKHLGNLCHERGILLPSKPPANARGGGAVSGGGRRSSGGGAGGNSLVINDLAASMEKQRGEQDADREILEGKIESLRTLVEETVVAKAAVVESSVPEVNAKTQAPKCEPLNFEVCTRYLPSKRIVPDPAYMIHVPKCVYYDEFGYCDLSRPIAEAFDDYTTAVNLDLSYMFCSTHNGIYPGCCSDGKDECGVVADGVSSMSAGDEAKSKLGPKQCVLSYIVPVKNPMLFNAQAQRQNIEPPYIKFWTCVPVRKTTCTCTLCLKRRLLAHKAPAKGPSSYEKYVASLINIPIAPPLPLNFFDETPIPPHISRLFPGINDVQSLFSTKFKYISLSGTYERVFPLTSRGSVSWFDAFVGRNLPSNPITNWFINAQEVEFWFIDASNKDGTSDVRREDLKFHEDYLRPLYAYFYLRIDNIEQKPLLVSMELMAQGYSDDGNNYTSAWKDNAKRRMQRTGVVNWDARGLTTLVSNSVNALSAVISHQAYQQRLMLEQASDFQSGDHLPARGGPQC